MRCGDLLRPESYSPLQPGEALSTEKQGWTLHPPNGVFCLKEGMWRLESPLLSHYQHLNNVAKNSVRSELEKQM